MGIMLPINARKLVRLCQILIMGTLIQDSVFYIALRVSMPISITIGNVIRNV